MWIVARSGIPTRGGMSWGAHGPVFSLVDVRAGSLKITLIQGGGGSGQIGLIQHPKNTNAHGYDQAGRHSPTRTSHPYKDFRAHIRATTTTAHRGAGRPGAATCFGSVQRTAATPSNGQPDGRSAQKPFTNWDGLPAHQYWTSARPLWSAPPAHLCDKAGPLARWRGSPDRPNLSWSSRNLRNRSDCPIHRTIFRRNRMLPAGLIPRRSGRQPFDPAPNVAISRCSSARGCILTSDNL